MNKYIYFYIDFHYLLLLSLLFLLRKFSTLCTSLKKESSVLHTTLLDCQQVELSRSYRYIYSYFLLQGITQYIESFHLALESVANLCISDFIFTKKSNIHSIPYSTLILLVFFYIFLLAYSNAVSSERDGIHSDEDSSEYAFAIMILLQQYFYLALSKKKVLLLKQQKEKDSLN